MPSDKSMMDSAAENKVLKQTLARQGARLESSIKLLSALYRLSTVPVQTDNLSEAAEAVLDALVSELGDISNCSLMLHDPEDDVLRLLAARGQSDLLGGENLSRNRDLTFAPGEGIAGRVFTDNQPIFWDIGSEDEGLLKKDGKLSVPRSLACLPLSPLDRRLGVLNVSFDVTRPFDLPRRRDLILLSGVVANIIHSLLLRVDINQFAESLKTQINAYELELEERRKAEQARRASETRYRLVADAVRDVIWSMDISSMRFTYVSPSVLAQTGYTVEEALEWKVESILEPESYSQMMTRLLTELSRDKGDSKGADQAREVEYRQIRKNGELFWVGATITPVRDENGVVTGLVGVSRDLTERKRLEQQLQQAHKMEAVGTLAGGVAHDFNNILQAILGFANLAADSGDLSPPNQHRMKMIIESTEKAGDLVQRLLTFSRKVEPRLGPLDLNREVTRAVELLGHILPKMIAIETELDQGLESVEGDATQIEQILLNLAANARDAMPEGGTLRFETGGFTMDEEFCRGHLGAKPGRYTRLTVSDNGNGMEPDVLPHVFEPFYTTKDVGEGTGLGLAMVYGIVKNHDGYISCRSDPETGTCFDIYLPVTSLPAVEPEDERQALKVEGGDEVILLVDDEAALREMISEGLGAWGYEVLTAKSGEEAMVIVEDPAKPVDLVILDLGMPGMGGAACLEKLNRLNDQLKVIISSGYSPSPEAQNPIEYGAADFLAKPYQLQTLLAKVREVLDLPAGARPIP